MMKLNHRYSVPMSLWLVVVIQRMTTGATLDELALTLKRAGAARVVNWVVARTLPPS